MAYEDLMRSGIDKLGELKRMDKWVLSANFPDGPALDAFTCKTASRPTVTNDVTEITYMNQKRKFKGKTSWDNISLTLHDPISPASSKKVMAWVLKHNDYTTGTDGYKSQYAIDLVLELLSPIGTVMEKWTLHNAWITSANFGSLDMNSGDPVEISLDIAYDWATLDEITPE